MYNKNIMAVMFASIAFSTVAIAEDILPPTPVDGQCYAQKWTEPDMSDGTTTVVVKEAYTSYTVTPAVFEKIPTEVVLRDAYIEYAEIPPVFLTETVEIATGGGPHWELNACTDGILPKGQPNAYCFSDTSDGGNGITEVEVIKVVKDAELEEIPHGAESQLVDYYKLVTPSTVVEIDHPAETAEIPTSSITSPGSLTWVVQDCGAKTQPVETAADLNHSEIMALQHALNEAGFDAGYEDGIVGFNTRSAILNYKAMNGLPKTSVISVELISKLGL